jgi:hypothetical protein
VCSFQLQKLREAVSVGARSIDERIASWWGTKTLQSRAGFGLRGRCPFIITFIRNIKI